MHQHINPSDTNGGASSENGPAQKIAESPNPRANENIQHTAFEEKSEAEPGDDVGTEITDGESG
jgi:hypothetical protein